MGQNCAIYLVLCATTAAEHCFAQTVLHPSETSRSKTRSIAENSNVELGDPCDPGSPVLPRSLYRVRLLANLGLRIWGNGAGPRQGCDDVSDEEDLNSDSRR